MRNDEKVALRAQVAVAYLSGMTQQQVADKFGIHV